MRLLVSILVAGVAGSSGQEATSRPDFGGLWKLNPDESEDAREKIRDAMKGMQGGFAGGVPRGGSFGGGRGGSPMGPPPGGYGERGDDQRENMQTLLRAPLELTVTQTEKEIVVVEKGGRLRTLHPDGKKHKAGGGGSETRTRWDADRLVVETRTEFGSKITQTLVLHVDGRKMTVGLRLDNPMISPVSIVRVYDRVEEPLLEEKKR